MKSFLLNSTECFSWSIWRGQVGNPDCDDGGNDDNDGDDGDGGGDDGDGGGDDGDDQDLDDKPIPFVALVGNKVDLPDERAVPRLNDDHRSVDNQEIFKKWLK